MCTCSPCLTEKKAGNIIKLWGLQQCILSEPLDVQAEIRRWGASGRLIKVLEVLTSCELRVNAPRRHPNKKQSNNNIANYNLTCGMKTFIFPIGLCLIPLTI